MKLEFPGFLWCCGRAIGREILPRTVEYDLAKEVYNMREDSDINQFLRKLSSAYGVPIEQLAQYAGPEFTNSLIPNMHQTIPDHFFNPKIKKALEYAKIVHDGQKYGEHPYVKHLTDVYKVFLEYAVEPIYKVERSSTVIDRAEDLACSIWLHDAIEDTSTTKEEIEEIFGSDVANLVYSVTGVGKNRKERLASIESKIEEFPDAIVVKLADRIANTRSSSDDYFAGKSELFLMYVKEFPEFKRLLSPIYGQVEFVQKMWDYLESISHE